VTSAEVRTARLAGSPLAEPDWPDWRALLLDGRVATGGLRH
jgi:hypothetical protein